MALRRCGHEGLGRTPVKRCKGPECEREATVGDHCVAHYMQGFRGGPLKPLRSGDASEQVTFRCPPALKKAAEKAAKAEGIDPAEWWRRAGNERLSR